jgi:hypothetical protein
MAEVLWELVNKMLEMEDDISPEIKEQLSEVRQWIADEYINKLVKENPAMLALKDQIKDYLVNEWWVKDVFLDIFRQHWLSILIPDQMDNLNFVKEKLSWIKEIPTSDALSELKSEIIDGHVLANPATTSNPADASQWETTWSESTWSETTWSETASSEPMSREWWEVASQAVPEHVDWLSESQWRFIEEVYKSAASQIWVKYKWGWVSPETWFDCSWLWNWAFKQQGIKFKQRLTAATFSWADVDVAKDQVTVWDFMYWDQKPWKKKHSSIYHIEMVISKPYQKNWKMYVRTLGSSTDAKDDCRNYVWKGVRVREREMKDYRHFWRPPYYYQLAEYEKTGNKDALVATAAKPSSEVADKIA